MGRDVAGQQREWWQAQIRQDSERQPLAQTSSRPSSLGRSEKEEQLFGSAVWSSGPRGEERNHAIVAVGRTILIAAYHVLKEEVEYQDLGGNYFDQLNEERTKRYLVHRLEKLGYEVSLKEFKQAA